jgi:hypothetical protein
MGKKAQKVIGNLFAMGSISNVNPQWEIFKLQFEVDGSLSPRAFSSHSSFFLSQTPILHRHSPTPFEVPA